MARPRVPLISRRKALEAALHIIDTEGIEALSIRRLAHSLKVNGASLYHHFKNKDEIVVLAARLALEDVMTPVDNDEPWRVWLLRKNRALRESLRRHPDLVPVLLRVGPLQINPHELDKTVTRLREEGVPVGAIAPILEGLELYVIGSALHEASGQSIVEALPAEFRTPNLQDAFDRRALTPDDVFNRVSGQIIDTMLAAATERAAAEPAVAAAEPRRSPKSAVSKAAASKAAARKATASKVAASTTAAKKGAAGKAVTRKATA